MNIYGAFKYYVNKLGGWRTKACADYADADTGEDGGSKIRENCWRNTWTLPQVLAIKGQIFNEGPRDLKFSLI